METLASTTSRVVPAISVTIALSLCTLQRKYCVQYDVMVQIIMRQGQACNLGRLGQVIGQLQIQIALVNHD